MAGGSAAASLGGNGLGLGGCAAPPFTFVNLKKGRAGQRVVGRAEMAPK